MADNNQLNYGWLYKLTNPHHDGTTQQADDFMQAFVSDNPVFNQKRDNVHQCRQNEDQAWIKSQRDPAVKRLEDAYEMAGHYVLQAHAQLPDDEPMKAAASRVAVITMVEMTIQAEAITQAVVTIPAVVAAAEPIPTIRRTTKTKPRSGN